KRGWTGIIYMDGAGRAANRASSMVRTPSQLIRMEISTSLKCSTGACRSFIRNRGRIGQSWSGRNCDIQVLTRVKPLNSPAREGNNVLYESITRARGNLEIGRVHHLKSEIADWTGRSVGAVYDRRHSSSFDILGGHRPLQFESCFARDFMCNADSCPSDFQFRLSDL